MYFSDFNVVFWWLSMVMWASSPVFPLVVSSVSSMSLYELLQGQGPAGLGGFAHSTFPSPLTSSEAHTWYWGATKRLLMNWKVIPVSRKRPECPRVFAGSADLLFGLFLSFRCPKFRRCISNNSYKNEGPLLHSFSSQLLPPFLFFFWMWMTMFKSKPHLTQINVNRCTKSCIEVKY